MTGRMNQLISVSFKKWCYNLTGLRQIGLMRDDCRYEDEDVQVALTRLPQKLIDERNFRLVRAAQLDVQKRILPKEQWLEYEDDVMYLEPYVQEAKKEREERERWENS